jgi:hypothetical protein
MAILNIVGGKIQIITNLESPNVIDTAIHLY